MSKEEAVRTASVLAGFVLKRRCGLSIADYECLGMSTPLLFVVLLLVDLFLFFACCFVACLRVAVVYCLLRVCMLFLLLVVLLLCYVVVCLRVAVLCCLFAWLRVVFVAGYGMSTGNL